MTLLAGRDVGNADQLLPLEDEADLVGDIEGDVDVAINREIRRPVMLAGPEVDLAEGGIHGFIAFFRKAVGPAIIGRRSDRARLGNDRRRRRRWRRSDRTGGEYAHCA